MEEEEEPKEGEEPKAEVTSVVFLDISVVVSFFNCYQYQIFFFVLFYQGDVKKTKKTKTEKFWDWELGNETKPIWVSLSYIGVPMRSVTLPIIYF